MNEMLYVIPVLAIILVCIWSYLEHRAGSEATTEYHRDKERIDKLTDTVEHCTAGVTECESATERIAEAERRTDVKLSTAEESVYTAKTGADRIEQLADECLSILDEAEKEEK